MYIKVVAIHELLCTLNELYTGKYSPPFQTVLFSSFCPYCQRANLKTGRNQNSFLNNCFNLKEYGSYHILVHVFHFLCEFKIGQNCLPN